MRDGTEDPLDEGQAGASEAEEEEVTPEQQKAILGEVGRRSFWWYFLYGFGAAEYCRRNPADNWVYPPLHRHLCYWLQLHVLDWLHKRNKGIREPKKLLIDMFRGGGKSTIGCSLDTWLQLLDPNLSEIISSYDDDKSKEFLGVDRVVFEGTSGFGLFTQLYGIWSPPSDERLWQREALVHMKRTSLGIRDYSIRTTSVSKGATGSRPDIYRLDDPIVREKLTKEPTWPLKAREHLDSMKWAVKTNGLYVVPLTPYLENDVAGKILMEEGVASLTCPGRQLAKDRYKRGGEWHVFFCPVRDPEGHSMMPNVYPDERLARMEADDPDDFAAQMMCEPASGSHMPLRVEDIEHLWVAREDVRRHWPTSVHIDTAFKDPKKREKGCYSVIEIWSHDRSTGSAYYIDGWRSRSTTGKEFTDVLVAFLADLHREKRWPYVVTDDAPTSGHGQLFPEFLAGACRQAGLPIPNYLALPRSGTTKDQRILQAVYGWKAGKVRLVQGANEVNQLVYEMTHIGYSHTKDMADAGADVFHPDVYTPDLGYTGGEVPVPARPYDDLMWSRPGDMTDEDLRTIYDHEEDERAKWEGLVN